MEMRKKMDLNFKGLQLNRKATQTTDSNNKTSPLFCWHRII